MLGQVVAPHEPPLAHRARKLLLTRVRSAVTGQFIRPRKPPLTAFPTTAEGLFS